MQKEGGDKIKMFENHETAYYYIPKITCNRYNSAYTYTNVF